MTRLLIQCQGSPEPLSFEVTKDKAAAVLHHYINYPRHCVIPIGSDCTESDCAEWHYVNLALVSWMSIIDESGNGPAPDLIPTKAS